MTKKVAELWPREMCEEARDLALTKPNYEVGSFLEWTWRFGCVTNERPKRSAICAQCGDVIPPHGFAFRLRRLSDAGRSPMWRYIHSLPCSKRS